MESLMVILCVNQNNEKRRASDYFNAVEKQLFSCLKDVHINNATNLAISYLLFWAINTGKTATPKIRQEMHDLSINLVLKDLERDMSSLIIIYGSSINPVNKLLVVAGR